MELKVKEITIPERIDFNFEELKAELMEKAELYATVVYTEEQIKQAKADRAALNKLKAAINDERLRREREYMRPFIEFKANIDEIIAIIDKPIAAIDKQIKAAEAREQEEKRNKIVELFDGLANKPEWLRIEQIWDARWLNKSVTFRMIEENMLGWCGRIDTELNTISQLAGGAFEAAEVYKETLDLGRAISEGNRIAQIAKRKAEQAAQHTEAAAEAMNAVAGGAVKAADALDGLSKAAPAEERSGWESEASWVRFDALLDMEHAIKLNKFCKDTGIKLRPVMNGGENE